MLAGTVDCSNLKLLLCVCRSLKVAINSYILRSLELERVEELVWNNKATF